MSNIHAIQTMVEMMEKLKIAVKKRDEAIRQVSDLSTVIKALAPFCGDEELKAEYVALLEEFSGKPSFMDAIRTTLRDHPKGLVPIGIKVWIQVTKKMDLSVYSNPMASIHTTLRRMKDNGEITDAINEKGEKVYLLISKSSGMTCPPEPAALHHVKQTKDEAAEKLNRDLLEGTEALVAPRRPRRTL
jgi:hypothetical protein